MNKTIIAVAGYIIYSSLLFSQADTNFVLAEIEKNNTTLSALRKSIEAEKIANKTGIYLQNPEFNFNYLWGNPSVVGKRTDVSIKQTFDFPTAYRFKNQISNIKNEQTELEYLKQKQILLLQARLVCVELVYSNSLKSEFSKRLIQAQHLAGSYKHKYESGETNILEFNKAQLNLLNTANELESVEIERISFLSELASLNGGKFIEFEAIAFNTVLLPSDFEQWYSSAEQNNPLLSWLKAELQLNLKEEKLNVSMSLPKFQAGYMSEKIIGEQFQGLAIGITIPLWENKNTVKSAKAKTIAVENIISDNKMQFYNQLKALHAKTVSMQKNTNEYRTSLHLFDNSLLLKKALDKGEITLIDYILELSFYYESVNKLLLLERELNKTLAEISQYL